MKKYVLSLLATALFMLNACTSRPTNVEDKNDVVKINRFNREKTISFLGIKLGTPNKRLKSVIDTLDNVIITDVPEFIDRHFFGESVFSNYRERSVGSFFSSVIGENNESYEGWGMAFSDGDSITRIHFMIKAYFVDSVFNNIKLRYLENYGDPDEEYEIKGNTDLLQDIGCYWNFKNDQRIYLHKFISHDSWTIDFERVEIAYIDMKSIQRKEELEEQKRIQERNDSIEERKKNAKAKERQQL